MCKPVALALRWLFRWLSYCFSMFFPVSKKIAFLLPYAKTLQKARFHFAEILKEILRKLNEDFSNVGGSSDERIQAILLPGQTEFCCAGGESDHLGTIRVFFCDKDSLNFVSEVGIGLIK
ncbi:hypothetical protein DFH08DRAFT_799694 [Mycena albidolilacea]|uniref:Uncharacterized protein n=1 Tax=Mycena albidolilacea TaxID=1033008 RepID=A0AAD7AM77_9AGAR|nr:hypothetical protein DFH08DRAFT_799694 [Mycena albidolilacea]